MQLGRLHLRSRCHLSKSRGLRWYVLSTRRHNPVELPTHSSPPEYNFFPPNHSVVRAEYLFPCVPYEVTGVDKIGFSSGFKPVDAILPNPPTFTIRINDTNPIFYYCSA